MVVTGLQCSAMVVWMVATKSDNQPSLSPWVFLTAFSCKAICYCIVTWSLCHLKNACTYSASSRHFHFVKEYILTFTCLFPYFCLCCTNVLATLVYDYIITNDACTITFVYASIWKCQYWSRDITDAKEAFMHLMTTGYQAKILAQSNVWVACFAVLFFVAGFQSCWFGAHHSLRICTCSYKLNVHICCSQVLWWCMYARGAHSEGIDASCWQNGHFQIWEAKPKLEGISFVYLPLCRGCSFSFSPPLFV